jgi:hypothetical protein
VGDIPANLRAEVVRRAGNRCEYCQLSQAGQEATFHVDHVQPKAEDGPTAIDNLALACVSCSLRKGARQSAIERDSGAEVDLFNPRTQKWNEHFRWVGATVQPLTACGRVTVDLLALNRLLIVAIREEERQRGRHPPA